MSNDWRKGCDQYLLACDGCPYWHPAFEDDPFYPGDGYCCKKQKEGESSAAADEE